jgi:hypothetical protein
MRVVERLLYCCLLTWHGSCNMAFPFAYSSSRPFLVVFSWLLNPDQSWTTVSQGEVDGLLDTLDQNSTVPTLPCLVCIDLLFQWPAQQWFMLPLRYGLQQPSRLRLVQEPQT